MMHRIPWVLLLACAIGWPLVAADDDTKKEAGPGDSEAKPPAVKGKWTPVGVLAGQVKSATGDNLTLVVEYPDVQQNPNNKGNTAAQRQMQNFQNQMNSANRVKNPAQRIARIQQIQAQMQAAGMKQAMGNFKTVMKKKDVDVQLAREIQVRVKEPPADFDEKGKPKKYTSEELKKLKGPGNLWGYPAEFDKIKPGAVLQVFLYKKTKKSVAKAPPKGSLATKDKDDKKEDVKKEVDPPKTDEETPKSKSKDQPIADDDDDGTDPLVKVVYVLQESTQPDKKSPKN